VEGREGWRGGKGGGEERVEGREGWRGRRGPGGGQGCVSVIVLSKNLACDFWVSFYHLLYHLHQRLQACV
jgi:hypothetical protein